MDAVHNCVAIGASPLTYLLAVNRLNFGEQFWIGTANREVERAATGPAGLKRRVDLWIELEKFSNTLFSIAIQAGQILRAEEYSDRPVGQLRLITRLLCHFPRRALPLFAVTFLRAGLNRQKDRFGAKKRIDLLQLPQASHRDLHCERPAKRPPVVVVIEYR